MIHPVTAFSFIMSRGRRLGGSRNIALHPRDLVFYFRASIHKDEGRLTAISREVSELRDWMFRPEI